MSSTTAWWKRFCAASTPSRAPPCTRISSRCATNTRLIASRSETASSRYFFARQIGPPSAKAGNVACAGGGGGLDQEAFHRAAVGKRDGADRERRRDGIGETAQSFHRKRPDLDLYAYAFAAIDAQQARLRR